MSGATGAGGATGGLAGGQQAYGGPTPPPPPSTPPAGGFSPPTTYAKGQPTPPRGTRVPGAPGAPGGPGQGGGGQSRRPGGGPGPSTGGAGRTRRARLRVTKADPWSVMKVSFLLSLALGVIIIVAAAVLWMTLDGLGVFSSLSDTLKDVTGSGSDSSGAFDLMDYIGFGKVMLFTVLIALVDIVLMTALATLAAFIYNSAAGFTGGIELTLAEED
ncbi:hypothetical protein GCM10009759_03230 [Kitasatospora saccharophila]|uniref:DUF3566 domain-containing protein n=1 Tax=Kitasatospora saccharophila TaxID=407973 RepID=A0ABN2W5K2_9ACTN